MKSKIFISVCFGTALSLISGCSHFATKKPASDSDGAPRDINVSKIPNPTPTPLPYSKGGNPKHYEVFGKRYKTLPSHIGYEEVGTASWYGTKFHGRSTSNGEKYDVYGMTAAHKSLPIPSFAEVTNLENGRSIIVRVNDRGPFVGNRIIDLSYTAAKKLGFHHIGTAKVKVTAIDAKKGEPQKSAPTKVAQKSLNKPLFLQLGAFSESKNAEQLAQQTQRAIKDPNLPVKVVTHNKQANGLYKVVIGPVADISYANKIKSQLSAMNLATATIIGEF